jgi:CRP-like cAMP-binding protein
MSLEEAYLVQGISKPTLQRITEMATEESYPAGAFLFHAGDPADYVYILGAGRIRLCVGEKGHVAYVVSDPGEVVGWSSMVELEEYTSSAECIVPVKVTKIEKSRLLQLLEEDPASGLTFFRHLSKIIGQRLVNCYKATLSVHGRRNSRSYG